MPEYIIRPGVSSDARGIAETIVEAFNKDFRHLQVPDEKIVDGITPGIDPSRFLVAIDAESGQVVGNVAIADASAYPIKVDRKAFKRAVGWLKGTLSIPFLEDEFYRPKKFEPGQAHLDYVSVRQSAQGQGLATRMLQAALAIEGYHTYTLEVVEGNEKVLPLYQRLGFQIARQDKESWAWMKGFRFRYWMMLDQPV